MDKDQDSKKYLQIRKVEYDIRDTTEDIEELDRLVLDFPFTEQLEGLFHPLSLADTRAHA